MTDKIPPSPQEVHHIFNSSLDMWMRGEDELDHEHAVAKVAVEFVEECAGFDCENYHKVLCPEPCGVCRSCEAREVLRQIEESGWTP